MKSLSRAHICISNSLFRIGKKLLNDWSKKKMSDDSKSFEKKLDRDFLNYLNLTKGLFKNVKNESDQQLCEVWLTHLFGKTISSVAEKCDRNIYLSRLLLQMQNGKLTGVFLEAPPGGTLPCAFTAFGLPTEVDGLKGFEEIGFQVDKSLGTGSGDFFESSRDGRTYLATRHLPQGIMAYMAVTNNEGDPVWMPQTCPAAVTDAAESKLNTCEKQAEGYTKRLLDFIEVPLCQLRKSPEERDRVLEWMDKIINDCNKWIQGEDPHNLELEMLFGEVYEDYKQDPENSELLKHPKTVRTILFRDIRDKISERRAEVSKRDMILDHYESEQYTEEPDSDDYIDEVWLECARKPLSSIVRYKLESNYPPEVIQRWPKHFSRQNLKKKRLIIIRKGEKHAKKKISELRKSSIEETKSELQRLKKAQDEYKEYYCIYNEIEEKQREFEKEYKERCGETDQADQPNMGSAKYKQEMEAEIQQAKRNLDREVKVQHDSQEKLEEVKEAYRKAKERMAAATDKLNCEANQLRLQIEDLHGQICVLKKKRAELKCEMQKKQSRCR